MGESREIAVLLPARQRLALQECMRPATNALCVKQEDLQDRSAVLLARCVPLGLIRWQALLLVLVVRQRSMHQWAVLRALLALEARLFQPRAISVRCVPLGLIRWQALLLVLVVRQGS